MAWWNKQGTASTRIPQDKQQYFSGTNPGAYGNWRNDNAINYSNTYPQAPVNYEDYDEQAAADLGSMGIDPNINNAPTGTGCISNLKVVLVGGVTQE